MVNIDDVYQKVLAFANKEQRGYITPQEFNLYADQAQKEIFEQYFYDLGQYSKFESKQAEYADALDRINEKISIFETNAVWEGAGTHSNIGNNVYKLGTVYLTTGASSNFEVNGRVIEIEQVQQDEYLRMLQGPLTKPTGIRPVYVRISNSTTNNRIRIYPSFFNELDASGTAIYSGDYTFVRKPNKPSWTYFVVGGKALYDSTSSSLRNFDLHESEETELVYKILKFAGISMKQEDISRAGQALEQLQVQQEKL